MMATNNLNKRIEKLEELSLVGKVVHYPETPEDVLELMRNETNPVFVLDGETYTIERFLADITLHNKPLVRAE